MQNVIKEIKRNDACDKENQTNQCVRLTWKLNQTMHNVRKKIKPNDT